MELTNNMPVRRRRGVQVVHAIPRVDMTPMVDLGFLLVAFFVMTTRLSEPVAAKLSMPREGPPMQLGESNALTVLLGSNNSIYYYQGDWDRSKVVKTSFYVQDGIGRIIREQQRFLADANISAEGRDGLMLLIKAGDQAPYSSVIDALDEALINGVKRYAIVKISKDEGAYLNEMSSDTLN